MKINKLSKMKGGWFIGNFTPNAFKTKKFEVSYKIHKKGEKWDKHYHKKSKEINLIIKGKMKIRNKILQKGDIFTLNKFEIADPVFYKSTHVICVKIPSSKNDKFIVD